VPLILVLLTGCLLDRPRPDVGECAEYPPGGYDYGEIGIGSCVAGPVELRFADNGGDPVLLVSNSNHMGTFSGGSLLAIPWSSVDLSIGRQLVDQLEPSAVDLPSLSAGFDIWQGSRRGREDLAILANRYSDGAHTRSDLDQVYLIDLSQPRVPTFSTRGQDGGETVQAGPDPVSVVVDPDTGRAYVANRSGHSVTVLDLTGEQVEILLPWPEQTLSQSDFQDQDGSGSTGQLHALAVEDSTLVPDELWTLSWTEGTFRLWALDQEGLQRFTGPGDGRYAASGLGVEVDPLALELLIGGFEDPAVVVDDSTARLYFQDQGSVRLMTADTSFTSWTLQETEALSQDSDRWDAQIQGPSVFSNGSDWLMVYGGTNDQDPTESAIGLASSGDGLGFSRLGGPILEPQWDHELGGITDPFAWYDGETGLFRMVYGAWDGSRWTIGHAVSVDSFSWTADPTPVFELDGVDVAAPVIDGRAGLLRMAYARDDGTGWSVGEAWSSDGYSWTDLGTIIELSYDVQPERPPGPASQSAFDRLFRLDRGTSGSLVAQMESGATVFLPDESIELSIVGGYQLGTEAAGSASADGIALGSVDPATGLAWFTLTDEAGTPSIGIGQADGLGGLSVEADPLLVGEEDYEDRGISQPTVVHDGEGYVMLYAALQADGTSIARASSSDGRTWTRDGEVLLPTEEWASAHLEPGSVVIEEDGTWRLFYSGSDGEAWAIGEATSSDRGLSWSLEGGSRGYSLPAGTPGLWDDSGVRDPFATLDEDGVWHLWYAGQDGDAWRIGYASREGVDGSWTRFEDSRTVSKRAILSTEGSLFHPDGALRPVLLDPASAGQLGGTGADWVLWYAGRKDETDRQGLATGRSPSAFSRNFRLPTPGDSLSFTTQRGDDEVLAIPLDTTVGSSTVTAAGLVGLHLDSERGFLYAVSKERPYVFVIDVRDDTPLADGSVDANYLDVETVISVTNSSEAVGFRQVAVSADGERLMALNDSPNAVWWLDLTTLQDEAWGRISFDAVSGYIPAPRGNSRDVGAGNQLSVGVAQMALHPDGRWLFVSNFNANSIGVYDLWLGPYGTFVHEIEQVGENPFALAISPDGRHLVYGNYTGEVDRESKATASTIGVIDIDPDSATWLQPLTWIVNR